MGPFCSYQWVIDSFVLDYFLDTSLWLQLPAGWRECLSTSSPSSLARYNKMGDRLAAHKVDQFPLLTINMARNQIQNVENLLV